MDKTSTKQMSVALIAAALQDHHKVIEDFSHENGHSRATRVIRNKQKSTDFVKHKLDYVLKNIRVHENHSLAKHLGLVRGACGCNSVLTESQWLLVKKECKLRNDHYAPCSICREDFALQSVVLLPCTHLFHKVCLRSFEDFCNKWCCPVCRQNYLEKRVVFFTRDAYYQMAATRIQAAWRAYLGRKLCTELRQKAPLLDDPAAQRYRTLAKMKHVHGKILHRYNISHDSVMGYKAPTGSVTDNLNLFFRDLDDCLLGFRGVLSQWEDTFKDKISKSLGNCKHRTTDATWKPIWNRHLKRGAGCCPICLVPWERRRPRVLLTCSHVFHQTCLETMETVGSLNEFLTASELNGNMCPVCRQTDYEKCSVPSTDD